MEAIDRERGLQGVALVAQARQLQTSGNHESALKAFLSAVALAPPLLEAIGPELADALHAHVDMLWARGAGDEALWLCAQCADHLPNCAAVWSIYGTVQFRKELNIKAIQSFRRCLELDPTHAPALEALENLKSLAVDRWHFRMLNDSPRNVAYMKAIKQCVARLMESQETVSVLDIGAGTGLLSMLAVRAGAQHVYACEMNAVLAGIAQQCCKINAMEDRVSIMSKHSSTLTVSTGNADEGDLSGKVDLIVTELVDSGLLGEHIIPTLQYAAKHYLKPSGQIIPHKATVFVMLVESEDLRRRSQWLDSDNNSLRPAEAYTCERLHNLSHRPLTQPRSIGEIKFLNDPPAAPWNVSLNVVSGGCVDAIAVWFHMALHDYDDPPMVCTDPDLDHPCGWDQAMFFLPEGCHIQEGEDSVELQVSYSHSQFTFGLNGFHTAGSDGNPQEVMMTGLGEADFSKFNDGQLWIAWKEAISCVSEPRLLTVVGTWSLLPIVAAGIGRPSQCVCPQEALNTLQQIEAGVAKSRTHYVTSLEAIADYSDSCLLFDLVEPSGLLDQAVLRQAIQVASNRGSINTVLPSRLRVMAVIASCPDLVAQNTVDARATCGIDLSPINDFGVETFRELNMHSMSVERACDNFEALVIDVAELHQNIGQDNPRSTVVTCTKSCEVNSVFFWFHQEIGTATIDTSRVGSHWRQACVMVPSRTVEQGQDFSLSCWCCPVRGISFQMS